MKNTPLRFQMNRIVIVIMICMGVCMPGGGIRSLWVMDSPHAAGMLRAILNVPTAMAESGEPETEKNKPAQTAGNQGKPPNGQNASEAATDSKEMKLMLEGLEAKRREIETRTEALRAEERRLEQLKQEIEEKIETLAGIQKKVAADLAELEKKKTEKQKQQEAAEAAKIKQLVKAYSAMKPRKAAAIINNMDIETAQKILMNMKGEQAGLILSYVNSDHAARISRSLALKKPRKDTT